MAYQRPFLISLKKSDPQQPWGFRTFGGKEYGEPHMVEKVVPDSVAERCGLREGDEIIQVGRVNVQDTSFGHVQELFAKSGNKIEMFVIREDLLAPRKGKEPSHVKAIVHNPYNSPLNLYSTENIAETLAKQTEVLTEGHVSSAEEEDAPENLSFKQKSAVFQLLEEQAKQESATQYQPRGNPQRRAGAPVPQRQQSAEAQYYQNKENFYPQDYSQSQGYATIQSQQYQPQYSPQVNDYHSKPGSVEFRKEERNVVEYSSDSRGNVSPVLTNHHPTDQYQTQYRSTYKVSPTPPVRAVQQTGQSTMTTTVYKQQYQQQHAQQTQQYSSGQNTYQTQHQAWQQPQIQSKQQHQQFQQQNYTPPQAQDMQQHQQHQQHMQQQQRQQYMQQQQHQQHVQQQQQQHQQHVQQQQHQQHMQQQYQQQQRIQQQERLQQQPAKTHQYQTQEQKKEPIFDSSGEPVGTPIVYKAPPSQKHRVNWPPPSPTQQNGRWSTPSPPGSPSKYHGEALWPPKQPTVKDLPKTGFNPAVLREQGSGRRCVWPPPKTEEEFRTTPQSPVTGRRIAWNPSPSPPLIRKSPFGPTSPVARRKDIQWPPPQPIVHKTEVQHRPSPTLSRRARFDDYVKQHASSNVPSTYRPPPGTAKV